MVSLPPVAAPNLREKLGERLRSARLRAGLSQAGLAERLNISRPAVASIESGRQGISVDQLVEMAQQLDVNPTALLAEALGAPEPAVQELDKLPDAHRTWILELKKGKWQP